MPNALDFFLCALELLGVTARMSPFANPFYRRPFKPFPIAFYPAAHRPLACSQVMRNVAHVLSIMEPK